jgi:hypothetical protein
MFKDLNELIKYIWKNLNRKTEVILILFFDIVYFSVINSIGFEKNYKYALVVYPLNILLTLYIFLIGNILRSTKKSKKV